MSSSTSSSSLSFSPTYHQHHHQTLIQSSDHQLCYVHCNFCDTILAVSVPNASLFKTVTVRCGHCTNLLSVNMFLDVQDLHSPYPSSDHQHSLINMQPSSSLLEETISNGRELPLLNHDNNIHKVTMMQIQHQKRVVDHQYSHLSKHHHTNNLLAVNKPPEKRQRVPSAYNRFIKEEIRRIKEGNPDISHREAFSAAAKNWAHFPHIQFGINVHEDQQLQPVAKKPNLTPYHLPASTGSG